MVKQVRRLYILRQFRISYQCQGDKHNELDKDKEVGWIQICGTNDILGQCLQVGGNETHVSAHKSDLRNCNGKEDGQAHVWAVKMSSYVTKGRRYNLARLDQQQEREK